MDSLIVFKDFIADPNAWEMFIEGPAGTGKTTDLARLEAHCVKNDISIKICSHTHVACEILRSKLSANADISTLHSFLRKRPTLNEHALQVEHVNSSKKHGASERYDVLFVDEFSTIGEKDYIDIGTEQDPQYEGVPKMKVVYIGDPYQAPAVKDVQGVYPGGKYHVKLTKIWRQADDNPLLGTISALVQMIQGEIPPTPLVEHDNFIRGIDIVSRFKYDMHDKDRLLAFTNRRVEGLNVEIEGVSLPYDGTNLFSPSTRENYIFNNFVELKEIESISKPFGDDLLMFGTKYKTLEHLLKMNCCDFYEVFNKDINIKQTFAVVFGHYQYKIALEKLVEKAVESNKAIEDKYKVKAKTWAYNNKHNILARTRAKAWRDYMTFKDCVTCMDFTHAMTIHKSQGSTFENVYLDIQDLSICADMNYVTYLKLLYVAISRASNTVYTN